MNNGHQIWEDFGAQNPSSACWSVGAGRIVMGSGILSHDPAGKVSGRLVTSMVVGIGRTGDA